MDDLEFLAHATDIVNDLQTELKRVRPEDRARWKVLEIGCGAGRLMRPLSGQFAEIHGVDSSRSCIDQARANLADIHNARLHEPGENGLPYLPPASYDFIYSLDAALHLLPWVREVLHGSALARLRFNGLGLGRTELLEFAAAHDFQVLAIQGVGTRFLWTTWRKRPAGWSTGATPPVENARIQRIVNAYSQEPVAPSRGRFASISIHAEGLPEDAGLGHLRVTVGTSVGTVSWIGPADRSGVQMIRVDLPDLEATGLLPVQLLWLEQPISEPATLRVIPPGPAVPRILGLHRPIGARTVRMTIEEVAHPYDTTIVVGGYPATDLEYVCTDPRPQRFEVTFRLPEAIGPGLHHVRVNVGRRKMAPIPLEVR
jgi:SAM-dependent methyltransferase